MRVYAAYHADMRLVYSQVLCVQLRRLRFPLVFFCRVPKYSLIKEGLRVLSGVFSPGWHTVNAFSVWLGNTTFETCIMLYRKTTILILRDLEGEVAEGVLRALVTVSVPTIKVTELMIEI